MALQLWGYGRDCVLGLVEPVAGPLVEAAAAQAAEEAAHVGELENDEGRG